MSDAAATLLRQATDTALPLVYRFATHLMLTMLDDPAILAMAFC